MIDIPLSFAKEYIDLIVKGSFTELGGILSDYIGNWRLKNRVKILLRTKEWLENNGINPSKINPEIFVPLIEDGGNVENEDLSSMFSSLLATHLDSKYSDKIHPSFSKVLSQLAPVDATLLKEFRKWVSYKEARTVGLKGPGIVVLDLSKFCDLPLDQVYLSCLNLLRLGLIEKRGVQIPEGNEFPSAFEHSYNHQRFVITEYGISFYDSCNYRVNSKKTH